MSEKNQTRQLLRRMSRDPFLWNILWFLIVHVWMKWPACRSWCFLHMFGWSGLFFSLKCCRIFVLQHVCLDEVAAPASRRWCNSRGRRCTEWQMWPDQGVLSNQHNKWCAQIMIKNGRCFSSLWIGYMWVATSSGCIEQPTNSARK